MSAKPDFSSFKEASLHKLDEPIWHVGTAELIKAPYDPPPGRDLALDVSLFGDYASTGPPAADEQV